MPFLMPTAKSVGFSVNAAGKILKKKKAYCALCKVPFDISYIQLNVSFTTHPEEHKKIASKQDSHPTDAVAPSKSAS